jgi:hypothetical protein
MQPFSAFAVLILFAVSDDLIPVFSKWNDTPSAARR